MLETSLDSIGFLTRVIYSVIGFIGITIILFRNNVVFSKYANLAFIKFVIVLSVSSSVFAFLGFTTFYKYLFTFSIIIVFLLNLQVKKVYFPLFRIFILLSIFYVVSAFTMGADWENALTIYVTLATPMILFVILTRNINIIHQIKPLIKDIIILQVVMSVVKLILIGRNEALVGTIGHTAGSIATVFPLLALIFLWQAGYLKNNRNFIVWIILLSIIAFASNKRAYWFMLPFIVFYIYYYKNRRVKISFITVLKYMPVVLLLLYVGLRLNSTLNPDKKVGGNFDLGYALNYAYDYTFAEERTAKTGIAHGRGAGVVMTVDNILNTFSEKSTLFGNGVDLLHAKTRDEQEFLPDLGFLNRGAMTGFTKKYLTLGLLGVLAYLLYMISILRFAKKSSEKHIYRLLVALVLFEFFFYKGIIFGNWGLTALLVYIVAFEYSNNFHRLIKSKNEINEY